MIAAINTRITQMLGIKYPVFQGGMAWASNPELAAAVSNAGGFGIYTGSLDTPEELEKKIKYIKTLTDKPFGINFSPVCLYLESNLHICIKERVKAITYGRGRHTTDIVITTVKSYGILCFPVVGTSEQAVRVQGEGADAIIVSGVEGGGHVGRVGTLALLPVVLKKVNIPVVAAGGFADGRGLVAALVYGADGIQMGTRFICTQESIVNIKTKQRMLAATEEDTLVTGNVTGLRCRVIRNKLTEYLQDLEDKKVPPSEYERAGLGKMKLAFIDGDTDWGSIMCGQIIGLIDDIPTCEELMQRIIKDAEIALEKARYFFETAR